MALASVGAPDPQLESDDCSMMHGLSEAIKVLCEPTGEQQKLEDSVKENEAVNKGRILCLSSVKRLALISVGNVTKQLFSINIKSC